MANVTIPNLPQQTGVTDLDKIVIVDSGDTTTSYITREDFLDGIGTSFFESDATEASNILQSSRGLTYAYGDATNTSEDNFMLGGSGNTITTSGRTNSQIERSVILGGLNNKLYTSNNRPSHNSFILGGDNNYLGGETENSGVLGGKNNQVGYGYRSLIIGGENNVSYQNNNFLAGGNSNDIQVNHSGIIAGYDNYLRSGHSFIGGGWQNYMNAYNQRCNGIIGGESNSIQNFNYAFIGGGLDNTITSSTVINDSAIIGGRTNTISGHTRSVILGGSGLTTNYDDEVVCEHLTTSGQSRGNFYDNLSGDTFTIDWDEGNLQKIYMTGDTSLTFSNVKNGATYKLQVENGGTHSITGVTSSGFTILCEGGSIPNITNSGVDLCVLEVMDTDILVRHFANFATP